MFVTLEVTKLDKIKEFKIIQLLNIYSIFSTLYVIKLNIFISIEDNL